MRLPIRSFATAASLQRSLQRTVSARRFTFSARWTFFAATVSFGAVLSAIAAIGPVRRAGRAGRGGRRVVVGDRHGGAGRRAEVRAAAAFESFTWKSSSASSAASLVTWTVKLLLASPAAERERARARPS